MKTRPQPKYHLDRYREFIRDASPFVSLIAGRKIRPEDADRFTEQELIALALIIDARADDLKKNGPPDRKGH